MKLHFLGTGAFNAARHDSLLAIERGDAITLIDCGEPANNALMKWAGDPLSIHSRVETILISHMHLDHVTGLPLVLFQTTKARKQKAGETGDPGFDLYLPASANPDILQALQILNSAGVFTSNITDTVKLHSLSDGFSFEKDGLTVTALTNVYPDTIESYAFLLEADGKKILYSGDLPGNIEPIEKHLSGLDLLIVETAHADPRASAEKMQGKNIRQVVYSHVNEKYQGRDKEILAEVTPLLSSSTVTISQDGMVLEL